MPYTPEFHSVDEIKNPPDKRVYHNVGGWDFACHRFVAGSFSDVARWIDQTRVGDRRSFVRAGHRRRNAARVAEPAPHSSRLLCSRVKRPATMDLRDQSSTATVGELK